MKDQQLFLDIIELTNQAMLYELFTDPSFGLVSPYTKGSHKDMNHYTFIDSISVLNKYMFKFSELGYSPLNINEMYDEAIKIGIECEAAMFKKTNGVNTHKGLIFVLGTLVVSYTKVLYDKVEFDNIYKYCSLLTTRKLDEFNSISNKNSLTNGEKIYLKHKIEGVRKEASLGFPIIKKAMNFLDLNNKDSFVTTLMYIMSECEDTTIINRNGIEGLVFVKSKMKSMLNEKFTHKDLILLEKEFISKGISPGGSADLLCGSIFMSLIENHYIRRD